jgi:hypothetical protein
MDVSMIIAVVAGPVLAVQVERFLAGRREERERKLAMFRTLMASRVSRAADPRHTEALNLIGVEFYKHKSVITIWRDYMAHLDVPPEVNGWGLKWTELFVDLLYAMAQALRFKNIDKTQIRQAYAPRLYANLDSEHAAIRHGLIAVLEGKTAITIRPSEDRERVSPEEFHKMEPTFTHPLAAALTPPPQPKPGEKL